MDIELLVTMANDVAAFFHAAAEPEQAARSVAAHLRNYWDPRMRRQIIDYVDAGGAALSATAHAGVALLAAPALKP
ncbi:MAG TPA: formate dehydrogenase subunit delta [Steroidobacteraceae bacterium]|nr:formate dehydrogenase subunit delta [Steroidobacteraceae bacterium]